MVKIKTDDTLDSLTMRQVLSNLSGILSYSLGLHTQSVPLTKKYMFFQFVFESDILDTSLSNVFLTKKW